VNKTEAAPTRSMGLYPTGEEVQKNANCAYCHLLTQPTLITPKWVVTRLLVKKINRSSDMLFFLKLIV